MNRSRTGVTCADMSRFLITDRAVAIGCAFVLATFFGLAALGFAQIVSIYEWCAHDAAKQLGSGATVAELRLDSSPALVCRSGTAILEMPIGPTVAALVFAVIGMGISVFTVIGTARRARGVRR